MRDRQTAPIPGELKRTMSALLELGNAQLTSRNWLLAHQTHQKAYELLKEGQPSGRRYDKSATLWPQALALLYGRLGIGGAIHAAVLTIIEELLTKADVLGRAPTTLSWERARNAQAIARIPDELLAPLVAAVGDAVRSGRLVQDPQELADEVALWQLYAIGSPEPEPQRHPGQFASHWSERVFVGGSYQAQLAALNEIAEVVRGRSWEPILAWEYYTPPSFAHHHSLMLLHECRWAVFEVTTSAGQLMELERTRDYGIEPLVVYQGTPGHGRLSDMVADLLARLGNTPMKYARMAELRLHVENYLAAATSKAALSD